jgi:hypothetical protein
MFEGICEALHRELEMLDNKLQGGKAPMNSQDLEVIDKMAHALKSLKTYEAMTGNSEYDGGSYMRGRSRTTGRYISRDDGRGSYDEYHRY